MNRDADIENEHVDTGWARGGRMNWEIGTDIFTLPCVKQITSENLLYSARNSAQCYVVT